MSYWTHHILPAYNSETKDYDLHDDITGQWCKLLKVNGTDILVELAHTFEQVWVHHARTELFTD